jgi:large subunit ribosomal protein L23
MMIDLVKYPILTEKSVRLMDSNQYTFDMDSRLTKTQIKEVIKEAFNVSVVAVNTHRPPRKKRRVGARQGYKSAYKRVIITLKAGESIQLLPGSEVTTDA